MIINTLRFRFKDGTSEQDHAAAMAAIHRTAAMKSVSFSFIGQDLGNPEDGYTHVYCVGLADLDALEQYLSDPTHRAGDFVFIPHLARLARIAMSDDMNPHLRDAITAIFQGKMANDAAWASLFATIPERSL